MSTGDSTCHRYYAADHFPTLGDQNTCRRHRQDNEQWHPLWATLGELWENWYLNKWSVLILGQMFLAEFELIGCCTFWARSVWEGRVSCALSRTI